LPLRGLLHHPTLCEHFINLNSSNSLPDKSLWIEANSIVARYLNERKHTSHHHLQPKLWDRILELDNGIRMATTAITLIILAQPDYNEDVLSGNKQC
jgi:hypothetical protein